MKLVVILMMCLVKIGFLAIIINSSSPSVDIEGNAMDNPDISHFQANVSHAFKRYARRVNANKSTETYGWMAYIKRKTWLVQDKQIKTSICAGTIISDSMKVLTAAHCICGIDDVTNKLRQINNVNIGSVC